MSFKNILLSTLTLFLVYSYPGFALTPNPLISRGKPVFGPQNAPGKLVNGIFGESAWNAAAGVWAAINVGAGPLKVFITWNCTNYMWADQIASPNCPQNIPAPAAYDILVSSNSTNGADGTWTKKATVSGNIVAARGHLVDFTGMSWVKMNVTGGSGWIDEIEAFDASNGTGDSWFFAGTSITANAFKGPVPAENFADIVAKAHPGFTPAIIRGGIGCIKSAEFARDISSYFENAGPVSYFCIEMGTNDGWGGSNANAAAFKTNLQRVIDSCKKRDIKPILARTIATDSAITKWQIHQDYLKAVDDLTSSNNCAPGPDLYSWFKSHPAELNSDGVHPDSAGGQSIMRLWAEAVNRIYESSPVAGKKSNPASPNHSDKAFFVTAITKGLLIRSGIDGQVALYGINGTLVWKKTVNAGQSVCAPVKTGMYIVRFASPEHGSLSIVSNKY
jgi:lysophospholipase L1-like esterase